MSDGARADSVVVEEACYNLPMELVLIIFKLSASSTKECAASISLVCSWARTIALPHLFSTIVIIGPPRTPLPFPALPFPERCGSLVRHLWIASVNWRHTFTVFSASPNLVDFSSGSMGALLEAIKGSKHKLLAPPPEHGLEDPDLSSDSTENNTSGPRVPVFACRSLCIKNDVSPREWSIYYEFPIVRAFLQGITHVRVADVRRSQPVHTTFMPNLTHFAFPYGLFSVKQPDVYMDTTLTQKSLQKLVLIHSYPRTTATLPTLGDLHIEFLIEYIEARAGREDITSRVFVAFANEVTVDEWKEEVSGGTSFWKRATRVDEMIANASSIAQALGDNWLLAAQRLFV